MSSEPDSFEVFFRRELGHVIGFLMKTGFGFDDSQDAAAEAMRRAYEAWPTLKQPRPWTFKAAHRIAVKKTRRDQDGVERAIGAGWGSQQPINPCTVVDDYAEVLTVLSTLPTAQRLVMAWRLHDFSPREIAGELDMAEATVRSHIRHARARLRKHFAAAKQRRDVHGQEGGDR